MRAEHARERPECREDGADTHRSVRLRRQGEGTEHEVLHTQVSCRVELLSFVSSARKGRARGCLPSLACLARCRRERPEMPAADHVPSEVWHSIIELCGPRDQAAASLVCAALRAAAAPFMRAPAELPTLVHRNIITGSHLMQLKPQSRGIILNSSDPRGVSKMLTIESSFKGFAIAGGGGNFFSPSPKPCLRWLGRNYVRGVRLQACEIAGHTTMVGCHITGTIKICLLYTSPSPRDS